jgi:sphinganine-1-phosphate aldolase
MYCILQLLLAALLEIMRAASLHIDVRSFFHGAVMFYSRAADPVTIFNELRDLKERDLPTAGGQSLAFVYDHERTEIERVAKEAFGLFMDSNALDFTAFPSAVKFDTELCAFASHRLGGTEGVVGNVTSGGTESVMLALKAARDRRPDVKSPEIVIPATAHQCFHKAAHYLRLRVTQVPVNSQTYRADPKAIHAAISPDTVLIAGSAVSYAVGVLDPIEELAAIARERDLWLHVDACIGGFQLSYYRELGRDVPPFAFDVPGVTSVSADYHKYGYTPKGASVILFRSAEERRFAYYACAKTPGYALINTTVQSTKSIGPLAAAWSVMRALGDPGYRELASQVLAATESLVLGLNSIPGVKVIGQPDASLIGFTTEQANIFKVVEILRRQGWFLHAQFERHGIPSTAHIAVSPATEKKVPALLAAVQAAELEARTWPGIANLADLKRRIAKESLTPDLMSELFRAAGTDGKTPPKDFATLDTVMNILPPELVEALMMDFANQSFAMTTRQAMR